MRLLVGDADKLCQLLLRQAEHGPPLADAAAHVALDLLRLRSSCRHNDTTGRVDSGLMQRDRRIIALLPAKINER